MKDLSVDSEIPGKTIVMTDVKVNPTTPTTPTDDFSHTSLVDFLETHHVDHSNMVEDFGNVDSRYIERLLQSWYVVWIRRLNLGSIIFSECSRLESLVNDSSKTGVAKADHKEIGSDCGYCKERPEKCQDDWDMINIEAYQ